MIYVSIVTRENLIKHLMKVADKLRPSFSQLAGLVLIGVLTSDIDKKNLVGYNS